VRFCEGRPERAARPLTAGERAALAVASRRAARKAGLALGGLLVPFLLPPGGALAALALGADPGGAAPAVGALVLFAVLGALPVAILFARDAVRGTRALRRDARRGEAVVFGDGPGEVVVLAESLHVIGRGGVIVAPVGRVALGDAAPPPPAPPTYALSAAESPVGLRDGAWGKRALSPEERAEIERHARRFGRVPPFLALASLVLAAVAAAELGAGAEPAQGLLPGVALGVVLALHWWRVVRDVRAAARLRADADDGWAYRGLGEGVEGSEVLPASGASWTSAGVPAEWRLHHGA
jgi:hypothetical protein